jgi:four helix bundle protein
MGRNETRGGHASPRKFGHEHLDVFKLASQFAVDLYRLTARFPASERLGLASQIRRASVSIPANIAEGAARRSKRDFARFLLNARGSTTELRLLLEIASATGTMGADDHERHKVTLERIFSMTNGLIRHCDAR